ncbi:hypothetical protein [Paraburkholderia elongata]|uniref:Uncharacterized protein n=1 Tax=Paraburkholderia elongata TaxID=2675747 RepID=A0A972SPF8_9BURK|nr:hypothetical protein [Paraburkholderia elongata]NPT62324.1 hypothetical protein [Paraburkholderia elongata]
MTTDSGVVPSQHGQLQESLQTLSKYLELALDEGECVVLVRHGAEVCAVYIGDPTGAEDDLAGHGTIAVALADEVLDLTAAGANQITIGDQTYRFIRSFTHIADRGAVVFTPA